MPGVCKASPSGPPAGLRFLLRTGRGADAFHAWLYTGGGKELWEGHRHATMAMHPLIVGSGPSEFFAHGHVPIRTVADLRARLEQG